MNARRTAHLFQELAAHEVPPDSSLLPIIRAQALSAGLVTGHRSSAWLPIGRRRLLLGAAALLVAVGLVGTARPTQAAVEGVLQQFGLVLGEHAPVSSTTVRSSQLPVASHVTAQRVPQLGPQEAQRQLEQVRQQVPFPLRLPAWVPSGLILSDAVVGHGSSVNGSEAPVSVLISYAHGGDPSGRLTIQEIEGQAQGGIGVPASHAQDVTIDNHPAIYARGASDAKGQWYDTADVELLSWGQDGVTYVMRASDLGLTREDLVRVGASFR
jgi:hypothetical protein